MSREIMQDYNCHLANPEVAPRWKKTHKNYLLCDNIKNEILVVNGYANNIDSVV